MKRKFRWAAYTLGLIRYCVLCDGSMNQARERGRPFTPDRWRWHHKHDINEQAHRAMLGLDGREGHERLGVEHG